MYIQSLLSRLLRVLLPIAFCSTFYLYLYPIFHGCAFPSTDASIATAFRDTARQHGWLSSPSEGQTLSSLAPFRLLVLADPQLEGDSSLPKPDDGFLPRLARHWEDVRNSNTEELIGTLKRIAQTIYSRDIRDTLLALRKRVDLFGNDYYLAHIFRTLHWWAKPTHVTVLGDLIGSQWVTNEEFEWRGWRYWNRVFASGVKIENDEISALKLDDHQSELVLRDNTPWHKRIINIAGNHDIGYAGDISQARLERFERVFGKANWDVRFQYAPQANSTEQPPTLHMIILNSLNVDAPALDEELQHEVYEFVNSVIRNSHSIDDRTSFTLLLTHLPLHKEAGICVDQPFFDFWGDDNGGGVYRPRSIKEQNHLSVHASRQGILEGLFGMSGSPDAPAGGSGRNGLILNGHDHEGCDVWHYIDPASLAREAASEQDDDPKPRWDAARWSGTQLSPGQPGIREITMRSMMGEFGGNAGLLSVWFDFGKREWRYDVQVCSIGVQHIWWAIHVLDIITICLVLLHSAIFLLSRSHMDISKPETRVKPEKTIAKG